MLLAVNNRLYPLFKPDGGIDQRTWSRGAQDEEASYRIGGYRGLPSNDLLHVLEQLRGLEMVPAIYFIFSRRGCREALQRCAYHEIDLTTAAEKEMIDRVAAERLRALTDADVEVGTIYEVAMGPTLVVESKFLPSYNMALNLLRVYTPSEAEGLMQRSFGQFQKRLAASEAGERLSNVRDRLADAKRTWDDPDVSIEDVAQYFKLEDRRRSIRIELKRLRREAGAERRGRQRGRGRGVGHAGRVAQRLEVEAKGLSDRQRKLKVVRSPRFGELLQRYGEIRGLQQDLDKGQREATVQMDEYPRKLRRLAGILTEAGFLKQDKPTDKGLFAARVYGENTVLVAEATMLGWFEGLTPEELCAVMVMLAAEDRERRGDRRQQRSPRRYPTPAIAQTARLVRSLYFRFADMERDLDEPNLRVPSHDYIDFAYRWASGEALDKIPLPPNVDIGDAIKAMKALYSLLRQLEFALRQAKSPLTDAVSRAVVLMERDVIKRTY